MARGLPLDVRNRDVRLADPRAPLPHTHSLAEVTGLPQALGALERMVDVRKYGVTADGVTDDTKAMQHAINVAVAGGHLTGIWMPPGVIRVTDTLLVANGALRGFVMAGSGVSYSDGGTHLGTRIVGDGLAGKPVLDLYGVIGFHLRDFAVKGNSAASRTGAADYGIRVRTALGAGSGLGLFENLLVQWCDQCVNFGNGGIGGNAADCTLVKCYFEFARVGVKTDHPQAVNHDLYGCGFNFVDDAFDVAACGLHASMTSTYDVQRFLVLRGVGAISGVYSFDNVKLDGTTYRTVLMESAAGTPSDIATATFKDVTHHGAPAGGARFKVQGGQCVRVIGGGAGLCDANGVLFDLDGTSYPCSILLEGVELPDDPAQVVGAVTGDSEYRVRNCFDSLYHNTVFIDDYGGTSLAELGISELVSEDGPGLCPTLPGDPTVYLDGTGEWTDPNVTPAFFAEPCPPFFAQE